MELNTPFTQWSKHEANVFKTHVHDASSCKPGITCYHTAIHCSIPTKIFATFELHWKNLLSPLSCRSFSSHLIVAGTYTLIPMKLAERVSSEGPWRRRRSSQRSVLARSMQTMLHNSRLLSNGFAHTKERLNRAQLYFLLQLSSLRGNATSVKETTGVSPY